jgi:putative Mg2+ transporter-C (MgtC) family protein
VADVARILQLDLVFHVLVAFALGGAIGLERERRAKVAGLRTHMLVAGGAALFTVGSYALFAGQGTVRDPSRVAAQIVTGVGFLGAGAIIQSGGAVAGLTTAASIWVAAAIGMVAGTGAYPLAVVSTLVVVVVLRLPRERLRPTDSHRRSSPPPRRRRTRRERARRTRSGTPGPPPA